MYKRLFPSTEAIKQQDGRFFKELAETIESLQKENPNAYKWGKKETDAIARIIKEWTNIPIRVLLSDYGYAVQTPSLSAWSPLSKGSDFSGQMLMKFKSSGVISGALDLNTGKVKGDFTSIHCDLHIPPAILMADNGISPEEHAALILHEIGHVVTLYEYLSRSLTTNWALKQIVDRLNDKQTHQERKTILIESLASIPTKKLDIDKLTKLSDPNQIATVVIADQRDRAISELGTDIYDTVSWEFLSDQYVTKHGGGRAFLTAYDKLFKGQRARSKHSHFIVEALKVTGMTLMLPATLWILPLYAIYGNTIFNPNYDRVENRLQRIRNQMVETLKDKDVPNSVKETIRVDITFVDETIKIGTDRLTFIGYLLKTLSGTNKERLTQEKLQLELEKLASNDLFIKAYDLKQSLEN